LTNEHVSVKCFTTLRTGMSVVVDARGIFGGEGVAKPMEDGNLKEKAAHLVRANISEGGVEELARAFDSTIGKTGEVGHITIKRSTKIGQFLLLLLLLLLLL